MQETRRTLAKWGRRIGGSFLAISMVALIASKVIANSLIALRLSELGGNLGFLGLVLLCLSFTERLPAKALKLSGGGLLLASASLMAITYPDLLKHANAGALPQEVPPGTRTYETASREMDFLLITAVAASCLLAMGFLPKAKDDLGDDVTAT